MPPNETTLVSSLSILLKKGCRGLAKWGKAKRKKWYECIILEDVVLDDNDDEQLLKVRWDDGTISTNISKENFQQLLPTLPEEETTKRERRNIDFEKGSSNNKNNNEDKTTLDNNSSNSLLNKKKTCNKVLPASIREKKKNTTIKYTTKYEKKWYDMYNNLQRYKEKYGRCIAPITYEDETLGKLGHWCAWQRHSYDANRLSIERINKLQSIGFDLHQSSSAKGVSVNEDNWNMMFDHLVNYKNKMGNCLVPQKYNITVNSNNNDHHHQQQSLSSSDKQQRTIELGHWVCHQRQVYKNNVLSAKRIEKLKSIGFSLEGGRKQREDVEWYSVYKRLVAYKEKYGDCLVKYKYKDDEQLGYWVTLQRQKYKKNKLRKDHVDKLKSIGFVFNVTDEINNNIAQTSWDDMYGRLVTYKNQHGDCLVPKFYQHDRELGYWVFMQRIHYKNNNKKKDNNNNNNNNNCCCSSLLTDDQITKLKSINFVFVTKRQLEIKFQPYICKWNEMYNRLVTYKKLYGNCLVPKRYTNDKELGYWVQSQRFMYNNGRIPIDRKEKLDNIDFVTNVDNAKWSIMYNELILYKKNHGHCYVPQRYKSKNNNNNNNNNNSKQKLGTWVMMQRNLKSEGRINVDRKRLLDDIGFIWNCYPHNKKRNDNNTTTTTTKVKTSSMKYTNSSNNRIITRSSSKKLQTESIIAVKDKEICSSFIPPSSSLPTSNSSDNNNNTKEKTTRRIIEIGKKKKKEKKKRK